MTTKGFPMRRAQPVRGREHGQIIVLFALALVAIIGMVGLVLDGVRVRPAPASRTSRTWPRRRRERLHERRHEHPRGAQHRGERLARVGVRNGYTHGTGGAAVTVGSTCCPPVAESAG